MRFSFSDSPAMYHHLWMLVLFVCLTGRYICQSEDYILTRTITARLLSNYHLLKCQSCLAGIPGTNRLHLPSSIKHEDHAIAKSEAQGSAFTFMRVKIDCQRVVYCGAISMESDIESTVELEDGTTSSLRFSPPV